MTDNVLPIHRRIDERNRVGSSVPITTASIRDNGTRRVSNVPAGMGNVHRTYYGKTLVVIEQGLHHGFVFEPGAVVLTYVAAEGSHPRDAREMVMTITGSGRMAAVHELPGGVQDAHGNEQGNLPDQGHGIRQGLTE